MCARCDRVVLPSPLGRFPFTPNLKGDSGEVRKPWAEKEGQEEDEQGSREIKGHAVMQGVEYRRTACFAAYKATKLINTVINDR